MCAANACAKSRTSSCSSATFVCARSSSCGATVFNALVVFASFFAATGFLLVEALRLVVLRTEALTAVAFEVVVGFGAIVFAAEDLVVANLADVGAFDTDTFAAVVVFDGADLAAGFVVVSSSVFLARPRRAGALSTLAFMGDSGGVPLACARCARVRTMLIADFVSMGNYVGEKGRWAMFFFLSPPLLLWGREKQNISFLQQRDFPSLRETRKGKISLDNQFMPHD